MGLGGAPVLGVYSATTTPTGGASTPDYHELEPTRGAEPFHRALGDAKTAHDVGAAVTQYPVDDYKKMRLFSTKEGDAGFALKGDDIVSVFKHPKAPYRNVTKGMLDVAKQQGGKRLDAFDTVLPHLYAQSGFRTVARLPWNEQYKPDGWKHDAFKEFNGGKPDVVFMAHDPQAGSYQPGDGRTIADYDEGEHHQRAALAHAEARGDVPAAPGPESYGSGQLIRMAKPITAYHGTPHEFRPTRANPLGEFDLSKLGTGEGAQAYGRGIYKAEHKGIAEGYRDELSEGVTHQGKRPVYSRTNPRLAAIHAVAERMSDHGETPEQAIERVRETHRDASSAESFWHPPGLGIPVSEANQNLRRHYLGVAEEVQKLEPKDFEHKTGQLYESELHIDPEHMLHWDKKISEHSPYVQDRVAGMVPPRPDGITQTPDGRWSLSVGGKPVDHPNAPLSSFEHASTAQYALATMRHENLQNMTGEQLHNHLSRRRMRSGEDKHQAAKALLDAGIPGITYLDAASRAAGKGTSNHVIFDPRTINIVKRNGLPAMVEAGADALRDHKGSAT